APPSRASRAPTSLELRVFVAPIGAIGTRSSRRGLSGGGGEEGGGGGGVGGGGFVETGRPEEGGGDARNPDGNVGARHLGSRGWRCGPRGSPWRACERRPPRPHV